MKTTNVHTLVERLVQRMDLHRIFLFSYPFLEEEQHLLLLVVNPVKGLSPKAMAPIVSLCMSDVGEIPFDMVLTGEWQNQLKQGSLYYTYASLPQHTLFAASGKNPFLSNKTIRGLLEVAQLNYDKCRKSSDEFREAVNNYVAKNDYGQATFMLHQFLEVRLKGFQATVGINGGKSHNIEHLMKSVKAIAPQLLSILLYDSPSVELFRLLDQSYAKGKKMETVEITEEEFHILLEKCEQACAATDGMVATMVERIVAYQKQLPDVADNSEKVTGDQQVVTPKANTKLTSSQQVCEDFSSFPWPEQYKQDVNALLDDSYQKHRPEQIMMLNYHTGGFSGSNLFQQRKDDDKRGVKAELYLVLLMKNKGPFHFKCKKHGSASAMMLYLNVDEVKKRLTEGDRFVHTLWTKGWALRKKSTFAPSFTVGEVNWKREHELAEKRWQNAKACMHNLNSIIHNTPAPMQDAAFLLLRNLLEIGVHTYLRCAGIYVPGELPMHELIDWSGIADRRLVNFLYPNSEVEEVRLHMVTNPKMIWWYSAEIGLPKASETFSREKSRELLSFFEGLCTDVLQELASKVDQVENSTALV